MSRLDKLPPLQRDRVKRGKCKYGCGKKIPKRRHECWSCQKRKFAKKYPVRYAFEVWRANCKRRGKSFNVTFDQFSAFNNDTGYTENSGRFAEDMSVDRMRNNEGYHIDNMQSLTISQNASKGVSDWVPLPDDGKVPF